MSLVLVYVSSYFMTDPSLLVPLADSFSSSSIEDRVVRFDSECVLIPDAQRRPLLATKSYSLPLWKKRQASPDAHISSSPQPDSQISSDATHIVVKVPIPTFRTKPRSSSHGAESKPLSPCIVYRDPTSPRLNGLNRRPSLSSDASRSPPRPGSSPKLTTIPLRACCHDCFPITEESTKEGEAWKVKFTYGARRRMRSASVDGTSRLPSVLAGATSCSKDKQVKPTKEIQVDEVDKRHSVSMHDMQMSIVTSLSEEAAPSPWPSHAQDTSASQLFPLPSPRSSSSSSPNAQDSLVFPLDDVDVEPSVLDGAIPISRREGTRPLIETPPPALSPTERQLYPIGEQPPLSTQPTSPSLSASQLAVTVHDKFEEEESTSSSPSKSPILTDSPRSSRRTESFTASMRRVGVGMIRGVSSMGGGGIGVVGS